MLKHQEFKRNEEVDGKRKDSVINTTGNVCNMCIVFVEYIVVIVAIAVRCTGR